MNGKNKALAIAVCAALAAGGSIVGWGGDRAGEQAQAGAPAKAAAASGPAAAKSGPPASGAQAAAGGQTALAAGTVRAMGAVLAPSAANSAAERSLLGGMERIAENDALVLYVHRAGAGIAVQQKRGGYVWFSNPAEGASDPVASPLYKAELQSQLILTYYNGKGQLSRYNSYTDSVQKGQFDISAIDGGVRVVYRFGNQPAAAWSNIPSVIGKERFEQAILSKLADDEARKQVAYKYRLNNEKQVYEVRKLQDNVAAELSALLDSAGYTAEDAERDNAENGAGRQETEDQAQFAVPVEYALDGAYLTVAVKGGELESNPSFPLASLQVLPYFGAADGGREGYMLVPDGSGALIRLNNGKLSAEPYQMPVYGEDGTFDVRERFLSNEKARLPVFGLKTGGQAFIGMMEDGAAMGSVLADIGGRYTSYNSVNGSFRFTAMDFYTLSSGSKSSSVPMFQTPSYQGDVRLRYAFLSDEAADYAGMAGAYRDYFVAKHKLEPLAPGENAPFVLELEGAFQRRSSFLGIPYDSTEALTTYGQAIELLELLRAGGVENISLRYVGWFNGGIRHASPDDIGLVGALGGKKGFRKLAEYASDRDVRLYPDVAFLRKYKGSGGSADFLDRRKAAIYEYDPVTYRKLGSRFSHYVLSASRLPDVVRGFLSDYAKLGASGVSLRDMGDEVNSDFDPSAPIAREQALETIAEETGKLKERTGSIMVSGGNAYTLPYADIVVNAPTSSSGMNLTDEDVPFYQIALHGYVELAGAPFNADRGQNPRRSMLKALETGSNVFYQWFYGPSSAVKDTRYNGLYALHYRDWLDEAIALYKEADAVLKQVRDQPITGHRKLSADVTETTFGNGMTVIVNHGGADAQAGGLTIPAESYRIGGEASR